MGVYCVRSGVGVCGGVLCEECQVGVCVGYSM